MDDWGCMPMEIYQAAQNLPSPPLHDLRVQESVSFPIPDPDVKPSGISIDSSAVICSSPCKDKFSIHSGAARAFAI